MVVVGVVVAVVAVGGGIVVVGGGVRVVIVYGGFVAAVAVSVDGVVGCLWLLLMSLVSLVLFSLMVMV